MRPRPARAASRNGRARGPPRRDRAPSGASSPTATTRWPARPGSRARLKPAVQVPARRDRQRHADDPHPPPEAASSRGPANAVRSPLSTTPADEVLGDRGLPAARSRRPSSSRRTIAGARPSCCTAAAASAGAVVEPERRQRAQPAAMAAMVDREHPVAGLRRAARRRRASSGRRSTIQPWSSITGGPSPPVSRRNTSPRPGRLSVRAGGISCGGVGG